MIIVGESINATLPGIEPIIKDRDENRLLELVEKQIEEGADYIDVNVSTGQEEAASMRWAVEAIQGRYEAPLCLDSSDPEVLEAGLAARRGQPGLINSAKAENDILERIITLAKKYDASMIALAMDEKGIPKTVEERMQAAETIISACRSRDLPGKRVYIDPLVMPIATDVNQGLVTLEVIWLLKSRYPDFQIILGLSNVSYGLPARHKLNATYLALAIYAGLDAAIMDPGSEELKAAILAAEALTGKDSHCMKYTRHFRPRRKR